MRNDKAVLDDTIKSGHILKFALVSLLGVSLFLIPVPRGDSFNIPLGIAIDFLSDLLKVGALNIAYIMVIVFLTVSALGSVLAYTLKPAFIMDNPVLKNVFQVSPLYLVTKMIAAVFVYMIYFQAGPEFIISGGTGGSMLAISGSLVSVFLILGFAMPFLTDFGIMEFVGVLIRKVVRKLFTCPGRSSIDLMASWFGSSTTAVILTKTQHESGFYTGREAAVITTNFSIVSIPFCFVVASAIGIQSYFTVFYLILCITGFILAIIMPRIWPLSKISDTYDNTSGKQINEVVPEDSALFKWALNLAGKRARGSSPRTVVNFGVNCYLNIFMDLMPIVIAWGTIALVFVEFTPVFNIISMPMGWYMSLFRIDGAMAVAPAALVGFIDMYIPALLLRDVESVRTQFILGALSLIQIVYMTEVGIIVVKSRIPVNVGQLFVIFMERTILALPIITLLTHLLVSF